MKPYDFEPNELFRRFREIEEGVYFKHYGIELPDHEWLPDAVESGFFGDIEAKKLFWQRQEDECGDSIALKSILTQALKGTAVAQAEIAQEGRERGWYHPDLGSSLDDFVELLKWNSGIEGESPITVELISNVSLAELAEYVDSGYEVVCYVNLLLLEREGDCCCPGLNADSLVHLIGISFQEDEDFVFANLPEEDSGAGRKIPLESFLNAWSAGNNTLIAAREVRKHEN